MELCLQDITEKNAPVFARARLGKFMLLRSADTIKGSYSEELMQIHTRNTQTTVAALTELNKAARMTSAQIPHRTAWCEDLITWFKQIIKGAANDDGDSTLRASLNSIVEVRSLPPFLLKSQKIQREIVQRLKDAQSLCAYKLASLELGVGGMMEFHALNGITEDRLIAILRELEEIAEEWVPSEITTR